jgi:putative SOS response-associated peptidase YedK
MIERYSISAGPEAIREKFSVDVPDFYKPRYNAAPTQLLPVITSASPGGVSLFYWGSSPEWSKNKTPAERAINTRAEHFEEKPSLKRSLKKNRCLIPADGFYAWKKVGKKTSIPYRFILSTKEIFSIAGVWEEFEDTEGTQIQTFTLITTESNGFVGQIQERMPLILNTQTENLWLDSNATEPALMRVLKGRVSMTFDYYPVTPRISDSGTDLPSLIIPTSPSDQHGNLTLFD